MWKPVARYNQSSDKFENKESAISNISSSVNFSTEDKKMAPVYCNTPTDKLAVFINSITSANQALRDSIQVQDDESGRLDRFVISFRLLSDKFSRLKELDMKHHKKAEDLHLLWQRELNERHLTKEKLSKQVAHLRRAIEEQSIENERLEKDLKENVERLHKYNNEHGSINTSGFSLVSSPNSFLQN